MRAYGVISFADANSLTGGSGGNGGSAIATGNLNISLPVAPYAKAYGGEGGEPGVVDLLATSEIRFFAPTDIVLGNGGNGGAANARGADGEDARSLASAQHGGDAVAEAGKGGSSPSQSHFVSLLNQNFMRLSGGNAGTGGMAESRAGKGGDSNKQFPNGGRGGDIEARGGDGGNADFTDLRGVRVGDGGDGGVAAFHGGHGGKGWSACSLADGFVQGGDGGDGGVGRGGSGKGGSGANFGSGGNVLMENVASAGIGGQGLPVGKSGKVADPNIVIVRGQRTIVPPWYAASAPFPCVSVFPLAVVIDIFDPEQHCPAFPLQVSVQNWGSAPVNVAVSTRLNPNLLVVFGNNVAPVGGAIMEPKPMIGLNNCIFATPFFSCIKIQATLGGTSHTFAFPYRFRNVAAGVDVEADKAFCNAIP